ncbi:hypothetical protein CANARDRAFT_210957 [[Candida] arabinofermentans NRRL YB-2248]|uniref:Uncharacterized protein n=1 Tax=[Candida] arabinofermentans NRRL YB-2248 TaxID=983967 RepID=A0A1E4T6T4_9ASCO|nr:hypothetical protein CANARDRAFT_210957 [[Candida] arabinofermentans NRRL YB-2248]
MIRKQLLTTITVVKKISRRSLHYDLSIFNSTSPIHDVNLKLLDESGESIEDDYMLNQMVKNSNAIGDVNKLDRNVRLTKTLSSINSSSSIVHSTLASLLNSSSESNQMMIFRKMIELGYKFNESEDLKMKSILKNLYNGTREEFQLFVNLGINLKNPSKDSLKNVSIHQYTYEMLYYTIKLLIRRSYKISSFEYLKFYKERLSNDGITFDSRYDELLAAFNLSYNKLPSLTPRSVDTTIPLILEYFIKTQPNLEAYLKILNHYLSEFQFKSPIQIHLLNTHFIYHLSTLREVDLKVLLGYVVALYPNSLPLLTELGLVNVIMNDRIQTTFSPVKEIPMPSIRSELISTDLPSLKIISYLYNEFLFRYKPNKSHIRKVFAIYLNSVSQHQKNDISMLNDVSTNSYHPFNSETHSSIILESFLKYIINQTKKPIFASSILETYMRTPIKTSKFHTKNLSNTISRLAHVDLNKSAQLTNYFGRFLSLKEPVYLSLIQNLIWVGDINSARNIYESVVLKEPDGFKLGGFNHFGKPVYDYDWDVPLPLQNVYLRENNVPLLNEIVNKSDDLETIDFNKVLEFLDGLSKNKSK